MSKVPIVHTITKPAMSRSPDSKKNILKNSLRPTGLAGAV
jgi:hypothetical protein